MNEKEYVETWNQAVTDGNQYWYDLDAFDCERPENYALWDITELRCGEHEKPAIDAASVWDHIIETLDENYYSDEGASFSDCRGFVVEKDNAFIARLQVILDELCETSSFRTFKNTNKWIKVDRYRNEERS